jgi:LacI family gluconate utilization system Gnt-I transcriptional repressor
VVFSNDDMAVGGYMHCLAEGLDMPGDLALFGFNGLDIGQALPKPLSTIRSNRFLIGRTAVETLLESAEPPAEPLIIDTGFEIIEGETA